MNTEIKKGRVFKTTDSGVRIASLLSDQEVSPLVKTNLEIEINDIVVYIIFSDNSGAILAKI